MDVTTRPIVCLTDFVQEHGLQLTRFAFLVTGDRGRAEDLVQDTLLAMHRRFGAELPSTTRWLTRAEPSSTGMSAGCAAGRHSSSS